MLLYHSTKSLQDTPTLLVNENLSSVLHSGYSSSSIHDASSSSMPKPELLSFAMFILLGNLPFSYLVLFQ